MEEKGVEFFTHSCKDQRVLKILLYGLPQIDSTLIADDLKLNHNIAPVKIAELKTKFTNSNNALYLLHFNSKDVNLSNLRKIKVIVSTLVSWKRFTPNFKGPTQCFNCGMFGHGASNCHRKSICLLCACDSHVTDKCPFANVSNKDCIAFKCFNCAAKNRPYSHSANSLDCPLRYEYIKIRNNLFKNKSSNSNQVRNQVSNNRNNQVFYDNNIQNSSLLNASFPALISNPIAQSNVQSTSFTTNNATFSDVLKSNSIINNDASDLLSISELFQIFKKAFIEFKQCKTRMDQLQVLTSLLEYGLSK